MTLHANDYKGKPVDSRQGQSFQPFDAQGYTVLRVLPELNGKQWDDYALGLVHALRPSRIRVVDENDSIQLSAVSWRVTVYLIHGTDRVKRIDQEVNVGLPEGVKHGYHLEQLLGI